jgi:hypothetical protein
MKRGWLIIGALLLAAGIAAWRYGILGALLTGWFWFLLRVGPQLTFDGVSLIYAAVALLLLLCGVHFSGSWLYREMSREEPPRAWRWRSSAAIVGAVLSLFAASIAIIGIVHQGTWLMTQEADWREPRAKYVIFEHSTHNLRSIGSGLQSYADQNGAFPKGGEFTKTGEDLRGWGLTAVYMLWNYYAPIDREKPWNQPPNVEVVRDPLDVLINPNLTSAPLYDADGYGVSHYAANQYVLGLEHALSREDLKGRAEHTLLVGEINANFRPWPSSHNCRDPLLGINTSPDGFGGPRGKGGAYFAMADGSVRFVPDNVDPALLRKMSGVDLPKSAH